MTRFEMLRNDIWEREPFSLLSPAAKLVYVWSFVNPRCPMSGIYAVRPEAVAFDTGFTAEVAADAVEEVVSRGLLMRADGGLLWVCNRVRDLKAGGPTLAKSIARDVAALPVEHPIRVAFLDCYGRFEWLRDELLPLTEEGAARGLAGGQEGASALPVVAEEADTPARPPAGGPMHLHLPLHGPSRTAANAGRARTRDEDAEAVWSHYLATFHSTGTGPRPTFDEPRRRIVADALVVRDVEQCKRAITGLSRSPHHRGENDSGIAYTEIRYALRGGRDESNEERIDRMAALATGRPRVRGVRPVLSSAELMAAQRKESERERGA